jgi:hypothetical protein
MFIGDRAQPPFHFAFQALTGKNLQCYHATTKFPVVGFLFNLWPRVVFHPKPSPKLAQVYVKHPTPLLSYLFRSAIHLECWFM